MSRILALAHALSVSRRGVALRHFADERGWPLRTLYRDIKTLEAAGFPIVSNAGRYALAEGWVPPGQAGLDRDEALALFTARQVLGTAGVTSLGSALDRLWTKLSGSGAQAALLPDTAPRVSVRPLQGIDYTPHRDAIAVLERAIRDQVVVRVRYQTRNGTESERDIEPGQLHLDPGLETLYCIAWCRLREAIRVFAVHRFETVTLLAESSPHRPELRSDVALRDAFRVWRGDQAQRVRLRFDAVVAREITERRWHASQSVDRKVDGSVVLSLDITEPAEIERWMMGFGAHVRVLEPAWLARRIAEEHERAAVAMLGGGRPTHARPRRVRSAGATQRAQTPRAKNSLPAGGNATSDGD